MQCPYCNHKECKVVDSKTYGFKIYKKEKRV